MKHSEFGKIVRWKWFYFLPICLFAFALFGDNDPNEIKKMAAIMGELPTYGLLLFSFVVLLGILFFVVGIVHQQDIKQLVTGRSRVDFRRFWYGFGIWFGISMLLTGVQIMFFFDEFQWNFQPLPFLGLLIISLLLLPIQTGFEELFFRGYLLQGIGTLTQNRWILLLVPAIFFGLAHIGNPEVAKLGYGFLLMYIFFGISFGLIALLDDGLELVMGIHFANNLAAALFVTMDFSAFQVPALFRFTGTMEVGTYEILSTLFSEILLLYILAKKYKWSFKKFIINK